MHVCLTENFQFIFSKSERLFVRISNLSLQKIIFGIKKFTKNICYIIYNTENIVKNFAPIYSIKPNKLGKILSDGRLTIFFRE